MNKRAKSRRRLVGRARGARHTEQERALSHLRTEWCCCRVREALGGANEGAKREESRRRRRRKKKERKRVTSKDSVYEKKSRRRSAAGTERERKKSNTNFAFPSLSSTLSPKSMSSSVPSSDLEAVLDGKERETKKQREKLFELFGIVFLMPTKTNTSPFSHALFLFSTTTHRRPGRL